MKYSADNQNNSIWLASPWVTNILLAPHATQMASIFSDRKLTDHLLGTAKLPTEIRRKPLDQSNDNKDVFYLECCCNLLLISS